MKQMIYAILLLSILLVACKQEVMEPEPAGEAEPPKAGKLVSEVEETTEGSDVGDVSTVISDISQIDEDLADTDLETLEAELAEIDW